MFPANQLTGIQAATLRMATSLEVAIISMDDSIMNIYFLKDTVVATDTQLVIQEFNIRNPIIKYGYGTHTNQILSNA